jgi:hypothetical protein
MDKWPQCLAKHKTDLLPKNASCKSGTHPCFQENIRALIFQSLVRCTALYRLRCLLR